MNILIHLPNSNDTDTEIKLLIFTRIIYFMKYFVLLLFLHKEDAIKTKYEEL